MPLIEVCTNYFLQVIEKAQVGGIKSIQPNRKACEEYAEHADAFLKKTVFVGYVTLFSNSWGLENVVLVLTNPDLALRGSKGELR